MDDLNISRESLEETTTEEFNLRTRVNGKVVWTFVLPGQQNYETKVYKHSGNHWKNGFNINNPGFDKDLQKYNRDFSEALTYHFQTVSNLED